MSHFCYVLLKNLQNFTLMKIYQQYLTVSADGLSPSINAGAQKMLQTLFAQIKSSKSSRKDGNLVYEIVSTEYHLPRSVNEEKIKTKWERFAESKGIKNRKKSQLVYSEELKKWIHRWGSQSLNNMKLQGGIIEVEQSISKLKKEKLSRIAKNRKNMKANRKRLDQ